MATREELFNAVRLIKEHCQKTVCCYMAHPQWDCPLYDRKHDRCITGGTPPEIWDGPEEGGGEDG